MMSHPAMSLGLRFCISVKGGRGGGEWEHLKGAYSMATSGLLGIALSWNRVAISRDFSAGRVTIARESSLHTR